MRTVVSKAWWTAPESSVVAVSFAPFEITSQPGAASALRVIVALRSGWSKQANIRLASAVSNWL